MAITQRTVWETSDGQTFNNRVGAVLHEEQIIKRNKLEDLLIRCGHRHDAQDIAETIVNYEEEIIAILTNKE